MLGRRKELPVYLFTGFLESGKTSFIKTTLADGQFKDGKKTSYLLCEEGLEEITEAELKDNRFRIHRIEEEEEVTYDRFTKIDLEDKPDRVVIEYNGTWDINKAIEAFPEHWMLAEGIATVNAATYESYLANMKQMMTRQFTYADLILFNRCKNEMNLPSFKRTAKAVNKRAQVVFEMEDGSINNEVRQELPYDIHGDLIRVEDDDYGLWYLDCFENVQDYAGKKICFKAQVMRPKRGPADVFVPGRFAMTCCAADIQFVGYPCKWDNARKLKEKSYVMVTARIGKAMNPQYGQETPVLMAESVEAADPPDDEVVYFQ